MSRYPKTLASLENIPGGAMGTRRALESMAGFVRSEQGKKSIIIRRLAVKIVEECPEKNSICEIVKIHNFVRDKIRYIKDVNGIETIHTPLKVLEFRSGDCDDKTVLTSALLEAIGYKTRLVAVGPLRGVFIHVLPEVFVLGRWLPLETTECVKAGWYPVKYPFRLVVNI